jgi:hypothetical protein
VTEVCKGMMTEEAVAYVDSMPMEASMDKLVRDAVQSRLRRFSHITLHTVDSLARGRTFGSDAQMKRMLMLIKEEALKQVGMSMPREMQLLDEVCRQPSPAQQQRLSVRYPQPFSFLMSATLFVRAQIHAHDCHVWISTCR